MDEIFAPLFTKMLPAACSVNEAGPPTDLTMLTAPPASAVPLTVTLPASPPVLPVVIVTLVPLLSAV